MQPSATVDPAESIEGLVDQAITLKEAIARQAEQLKVIEGKIIDRGAGKYAGHDGRTVTVVGAQDSKPGTISFGWPKVDGEESADDAEATIRKLCGAEHFAKLFKREVIFSAVEGFPSIAGALLTPARARDLVAMCTHQGRATSGKSAYLLYGK